MRAGCLLLLCIIFPPLGLVILCWLGIRVLLRAGDKD